MEKSEDQLVENENEPTKTVNENTEQIKSTDEFYKKALIDLSVLLNENPSLERQIRDVFEYRLRCDISSIDLSDFYNALKCLIPYGPAYLIFYSCLNNSREYLSQIDNLASQIPTDSTKSAMDFIRLITALYGTKIEGADSRNRNDWKWMSAHLYKNMNEDYLLEMELFKYSNEKFFMRMDLDSTLNFIERIIEEIGGIPKDILLKSITEDTHEIFIHFFEKYFERSMDEV